MMRFDVASHMHIIMPVVIIVLSIGVISTLVFITQHAEDLLERDFSNDQIMLTNHLQDRAFELFKANISIHNVARIIGSIFDKNLPSPSTESNVASGLFIAMNVIQLASQITYVKVNEVIFSYLFERDQIRIVFSNTSSNSDNSAKHQWYTQNVDNQTGKQYGVVHVVSPIQPNDSLWFSDALKGMSRSPSYGYIFSKVSKRLQRQKIYALANLVKQKEATQQAERKSINKSLAFTRVSHDMRASLAGITGLIRLCHDDAPSNSDMARNLVQMDYCASKLLGILNSVLDTSKVEAGKMQLEEVEFNMAQAIEESVDIFYVVAIPKGLEVIWDPCDFSVLMCSNVKGDCRRFKQILDNILSNAVKFTSNGHVVVRAWAKKACLKNSGLTSIQQSHFSNLSSYFSRLFCNIGVVYSNKKLLNSISQDEGDIEFIFEVDDTGIGIPKDKRASIFENYVQVKDLNLGFEGTGLGLGIVQSFVRLMGGDIEIQDKQPDKRGSCFRFNIFLKSIDGSSNIIEEGFDTCKIPILNRLDLFSSKMISKTESNMHAMEFLQDVVDEMQCLIVINSVETRRILKDWMRSLGIMVSLAQQPAKIFSVLKKMVHNYSASESDDPYLFSYEDDDEFSYSKDENNQVLSFSIKDISAKTNLKGSHKYLLVILDLGFENLSEIHSFLAWLPRSAQYFRNYKVICLTDSAASCSQIPCDLVLYKPLHGSRFCKILDLIQEFSQTNEELKLEIAKESNNTNELEKRTLLNSAYTQQDKFVMYMDDNEKELLSGMNILLVEDTLILRQIALRMLSRSGAIVRFVDNGLEALNVVKKALKERSNIFEGNSKQLPFDFILMDCQMPIMDGYEATKCIREEEKRYDIHIPIIALSAHATPDEANKTLICGMDFHLTKPLEINKLLEAIKLISQQLS